MNDELRTAFNSSFITHHSSFHFQSSTPAAKNVFTAEMRYPFAAKLAVTRAGGFSERGRL
jgi:hypothetical protein